MTDPTNTSTDPYSERVRRALPASVDIAGQWAWRLLAIIGVLAVAFYLIATFKEIVVAFLVALLISALLVPFVQFLSRHRWPRWLAIVVSLVVTFAILGALVIVIIPNGIGLRPSLPASYQNLITGLVLLIAAAVDALSRRRSARR